MWFGEPHPFPERGSPTGLSATGQQSYEGWSLDRGQLVNFTPRTLYAHVKTPWNPLKRTLGGPHNRSVRFGEEKNPFTLSGIEPRTAHIVA